MRGNGGDGRWYIHLGVGGFYSTSFDNRADAMATAKAVGAGRRIRPSSFSVQGADNDCEPEHEAKELGERGLMRARARIKKMHDAFEERLEAARLDGFAALEASEQAKALLMVEHLELSETLTEAEEDLDKAEESIDRLQAKVRGLEIKLAAADTAAASSSEAAEEAPKPKRRSRRKPKTDTE